jgi:ketosteroid isomerase-like protein
MNPLDELTLFRIRFALQDLNSAFTFFLDHDRIDDLVDLFTEDAIYTHAQRSSVGRAEILAVFDRRASAGVRTCRHMSTNLILHVESDSTARGSSVCMTFAFDGPPPIMPATPYLVADFEDVYRLCADGKWRIAVRDIRRIFAAAGNPGPVGMQS